MFTSDADGDKTTTMTGTETVGEAVADRGMTRALVLSLCALAVAAAGVLWFPAELSDYAALAWLLALIPAFLMANERGWRGIATALALGMVALTLTCVVALGLGRELPDLLLGVVVSYLLLSFGIGWLADRVGRERLSEIADLALIDGLTGLPNQEHALRFLEKEFAAARVGRALAVVLFELDGFDAFNARNGKAAGNGVLRAFATLLRQNTRRMNLSARFGEQTFLCVLAGGGEEGATVFGERVMEQLRAAAAMAALPTASAGIACYRAGMETQSELVAAAREALAAARADGGDRIRIHGWAVTEHGLERRRGRAVDDDAVVVAAEASRIGASGTDSMRAGFGRSAFVTCRDAGMRRRVVAELATEGFHVTEARDASDRALALSADFDLVVADQASPESFQMFCSEIRRRYPATRIVGVPAQESGSVPTSVLLSRADGFGVAAGPGVQFAPSLAELIADGDLRRRVQLQTRQLTDEVRARERAARLALEASEARYLSVVQAVQEVVFRTDEGGRWTFLNPAWTAITGYAVDDTMGRDALEQVHGEDRVHLRERLDALLAGRIGYLREEARCLAKDGEIRWLEVRAQPQGDVPGRASGAQGTLTDVTDRKNAEVALRRSEAYFRALIENSTDIMAVLDAAGRFRYASPAVRRICGFPATELLGRPFLDLVHADDTAIVGDALGVLLRDAAAPAMVVVRALHRNGTVRWLEISLTNMTRMPGLEGVVLNARDVTDRRDAERAVRESEELLHRARRLDAIGRLAGGVAHDFDALLHAVQEHVARLRTRLADAEAIREVDGMRDALRRAASLTRQLLAFGRQQELQPHVFELNAMVAEMEPVLRHVLHDHVHMELRLDARSDRVHADPAQIRQALVNLVVNARDALENGGRLTLATDLVRVDAQSGISTLDPGDYVRLSVADSGRGLGADMLAHLFDPFFTAREDGAGAGLGLSTVYGIVKQSGGTIHVESGENEGTTFIIHLPLAETAASARDDAESSARAETVVVVEDEASVRVLAERILRGRGFRVVSAANGREALALIAKHPGRIDLVLTDVVMPEMNGRELAERVSILRPGIRVLYMSGYPADALARHGVAPDVVEFLEKPFSPDALVQKVRAVLEAVAVR
jgi:diguanylate cyclase (GGDEF)-like protein/PAS domain S-box-containing protein